MDPVESQGIVVPTGGTTRCMSETLATACKSITSSIPII